MLQRHARKASKALRIEAFRPEWRAHFYRLNVAWLTKDFTIEPIDQRVLSEPEREILAHGGKIFFAVLGREVVGTCALEPHRGGKYELIKMAVDERYRGLKIGRALLARAIAEFHAEGHTNAGVDPATTAQDDPECGYRHRDDAGGQHLRAQEVRPRPRSSRPDTTLYNFGPKSTKNTCP